MIFATNWWVWTTSFSPVLFFFLLPFPSFFFSKFVSSANDVFVPVLFAFGDLLVGSGVHGASLPLFVPFDAFEAALEAPSSCAFSPLFFVVFFVESFLLDIFVCFPDCLVPLAAGLSAFFISLSNCRRTSLTLCFTDSSISGSSSEVSEPSSDSSSLLLTPLSLPVVVFFAWTDMSTESKSESLSSLLSMVSSLS